MTDLADFELRRARWRRALQAEGLDTVDQDDIALPGARCSSANAVGAAPPAARRPRRRADRDRRRVLGVGQELLGGTGRWPEPSPRCARDPDGARGGSRRQLRESRRLGEEVTWRAWHFGVPFAVTSRITELDRPRRFVDEQARGPFRSFRYEHLFARRDNRTVMTDRVQFKAPVGVIGFAVERVLLEWYLRRLIAARGASWMVVSAAQPG